jgi:hypothetical protein
MVAMHRSRGGDEIDVAVIPMTALQLDQGHARRPHEQSIGGIGSIGRRPRGAGETPMPPMPPYAPYAPYTSDAFPPLRDDENRCPGRPAPR